MAPPNLGLAFYTGEAAPKDFGQTFAWYREAAEQRHAMAQFKLDRAYDSGKGALMYGRQMRGSVSVTRFAKGDTFEIIRKHDLPDCDHGDTTLQARAGDFLVVGFRRHPRERRTGIAVDTPVVVPAENVAERLWPLILEMMGRYLEPFPPRCTYRTPSWVLQSLSASVDLYGGGHIEIVRMRWDEQVLAWVSCGGPTIKSRKDPAELLTAAILDAMNGAATSE